MSVINRNITRTIKATTETTFYTKSPSTDELAFNLQTTDKFYIGFKKPFSTRHFHFSTLNTTASVPTIKYWNGTAFAAVEDLVDQTNSLTQSGFISWQNISGWETSNQTPVSDRDLYWIEFTVGTNLDAGTKLQSVLNLFCDDSVVRQYYPEFITDTRYFPSGRTDFLEQYEAAKNLVVRRLKQDHLITDEGQIIDINEVALSAVHAFAWILLNPIAENDSDVDRAQKAMNAFNKELNRVKIDIDWDENGIIETDEENTGDIFVARG